MTGKFTVVFDSEHKYVTSYLISARKLGSTRLLLGIYALTTSITCWVIDGVRYNEADRYLSYFTHLSYIGISAYLIISGIHTLAFSANKQSPYPLQRWPRITQFLHESLYASITTFPIIVSVVYWGLIVSPATFASTYVAWSNISQHILNTVFTLLEIFITNTPPLKWVQLPVTLVALGSYLGVAYLTNATLKFYTYEFLNPKKTGSLLPVYIIGIAVGQTVVFVIVRYLHLLREKLVKKANGGKVSHVHEMKGPNYKNVSTVDDFLVSTRR